MEESRKSDYRVPVISILFLILLICGGTFLIIYCFVPSVSQPWFPVVALILIGSPWMFWLVTYIYTFIKGCLRARNQDGALIGHVAPSNASNPQMERNMSVGNSSMRSQTQENNGGVLSIASSRECEVPLNASKPSS